MRVSYRTTSVFNAGGQQTALVDARGNRQSFTYDVAGAQTQQIDALGQRTTLGYDAAGQQTLRLDANGNRTTYSYSAVGQVVGRKYPDSSRATFAYDATGNRTLMQDTTGRYSFTYDALNQTSSADNPQSKTLNYTYDNVGNRQSMQSADSGRFTYTFDAANQNTLVLNPFAERTTLAYDSAGRLTERRMSNGTRTSYIYDANSRRTNVDNRTSSGAAIATFDYAYDNVGNPTRVVEASGDRVTWTYDSENRLLSERRSGTNGYANTFTYDATGNRTLNNANSARTTYSYNAANQLSYSQAAAGRTTFSYDDNGNQTVQQPPVGARTTTTWNYENQPTEYHLPDASRTTLAYNADNRRVSKQLASSTDKFIWDPVADAYQSELNASNTTQAVYTTPPVQYGQTISQRRGATSHWYHPDSLGSTKAITNSSQATSDTYLYDAWGNPIATTGTTINPFRWVGNVGYYFDQDSGLYYIRARSYQPTIARWTSVDPLLYMLAKAGRIGLGSNVRVGYFDGPNMYRFLMDSPLSFVDPLGLACLDPNDLKTKVTISATTNKNITYTPVRWNATVDEVRNYRGTLLPNAARGALAGTGFGFDTKWRPKVDSRKCQMCCPDGKEGIQVWLAELHFDIKVQIIIVHLEWVNVPRSQSANWERLKRAIFTHEMYHANDIRDYVKKTLNGGKKEFPAPSVVICGENDDEAKKKLQKLVDGGAAKIVDLLEKAMNKKMKILEERFHDTPAGQPIDPGDYIK